MPISFQELVQLARTPMGTNENDRLPQFLHSWEDVVLQDVNLRPGIGACLLKAKSQLYNTTEIKKQGSIRIIKEQNILVCSLLMTI
jgi:hypothetical protein